MWHDGYNIKTANKPCNHNNLWWAITDTSILQQVTFFQFSQKFYNIMHTWIFFHNWCHGSLLGLVLNLLKMLIIMSIPLPILQIPTEVSNIFNEEACVNINESVSVISFTWFSSLSFTLNLWTGHSLYGQLAKLELLI